MRFFLPASARVDHILQSIYGPKFADAKDGLENKFKLGSLGMAHSGNNSHSSQFFIVLTDDAPALAKLNGKYVCFGELKNLDPEGVQVLRRLNDAAADSGDTPKTQVWVGACGLL